MIVPYGLEDTAQERVPWVSIGIAVVCFVVFFATGSGTDYDAMFAHGFVPAEGFFQGGLVTHMFMHAGWFHIMGNLFIFGLVCGPVLEDTWGPWFFGAFYLLGGIAATLSQYLVDTSSWIPVVGASGAIAACLGAFCFRFSGYNIRFFYFIFVAFRPFVGTFSLAAAFAFVLLIGRDLLDLWLYGSDAGVAFMAHIGGFLFGGGFVLAIRRWDLEHRWRLPGAERGSAPGAVRTPRRTTAASLPAASAVPQMALRSSPSQVRQRVPTRSRQAAAARVQAATWSLVGFDGQALSLRGPSGEATTLPISRVVGLVIGDVAGPDGPLLDVVGRWADESGPARVVRLPMALIHLDAVVPGALDPQRAFDLFVQRLASATRARTRPSAAAIQAGRWPKYPNLETFENANYRAR